MKRFLTYILVILIFSSILSGCGSKTSNSNINGKKQILKVGATDGPMAQILEQVKPILAKKNIDLQIVIFNDYVQPNLALAQKEIDANVFQHIPYFNKFIKDHNLKLAILGKTIIAPMGIYSKKYKSINDLPNGAKIAIPNDPTNGARALILLSRAGLFKLKNGENVGATVNDIIENKKNIKISEIEAAQTARVLQDVDAAAVNSNFALPLGLNPQKDAIFAEKPDSQYVNIIAIREEDKGKPVLNELLKAYQSPEIKKFIEEKFKGSVIPAF
ncbi:MetQ/NlpA family ABC transporter substrate-binding protein [Thermoanaerobacterium sp. RBIITD]|uniref:MetQ/NlpA family ABC transporter substrate-binding protein n=1 Tax=Thermoanaerobacterium sp. RBIITD TaxID=1550240 RepID=UPI000BB8613A|nr:MetQ/NlpA family ABC transporter substrate-binding protein [Thermoanaerobacterium sp. RBIITD]SNX52718.1 D-methionine transport system substrate-binding protein [Thermoanaerobacterium sp. RBIITD]